MSLAVRPYSDADAQNWDNFCEQSIQGTFLHSRKFLSYHGNRFRDCSYIVERANRIVGLLPAAFEPSRPSIAISHPGATYGGFLHCGGLRGKDMVDALAMICHELKKLGGERLLYKVVPNIYHQAPANDDIYALFRLRASQTACNLSSVVDLTNRQHVSQRRSRGLKKALRNGLKIIEGLDQVAELWPVLTANLQTKHHVLPTHNVDEMTALCAMFPRQIHCVCATMCQQIVAGAVIFLSKTTAHAQYIASSPEGYKNCALDLVLEHCIRDATNSGKHYFSFGISTEQDGRILNEALYKFKNEFGAGAVVHEIYEISLNKVSI